MVLAGRPRPGPRRPGPSESGRRTEADSDPGRGHRPGRQPSGGEMKKKGGRTVSLPT